jgi:C4-dicarboxylate transporter, DctM subunit
MALSGRRSRRRPAPDAPGEDQGARRAAWPFLVLFTLIIGGIYFGIFTPTEAAAIATVVAVLLGVVTRRLNWQGFVGAIREAAYQTAVVFAIAISAKMLLSFVALTGVTGATLAWVQQAELSVS